jgi:hypothetical protein
MKRIFLASIGFLVLGSIPALALDSYSQPGSITGQLGLGPYWGNGGGFNLQAGVDGGLGQISLARGVPLDLGVAGRAGVFSSAGVDAAAFATAHFSWKFLGSKWDWLNRMESYAGLGIQVLPSLSLAGYLGANFHFDNHWALFLEASALDYAGTVIGASYRF